MYIILLYIYKNLFQHFVNGADTWLLFIMELFSKSVLGAYLLNHREIKKNIKR